MEQPWPEPAPTPTRWLGELVMGRRLPPGPLRHGRCARSSTSPGRWPPYRPPRPAERVCPVGSGEPVSSPVSSQYRSTIGSAASASSPLSLRRNSGLSRRPRESAWAATKQSSACPRFGARFLFRSAAASVYASKRPSYSTSGRRTLSVWLPAGRRGSVAGQGAVAMAYSRAKVSTWDGVGSAGGCGTAYSRIEETSRGDSRTGRAPRQKRASGAVLGGADTLPTSRRRSARSSAGQSRISCRAASRQRSAVSCEPSSRSCPSMASSSASASPSPWSSTRPTSGTGRSRVRSERISRSLSNASGPYRRCPPELRETSGSRPRSE